MAIVENVEAFAVRQALSWLDRDPEKNLPKLAFLAGQGPGEKSSEASGLV